MFKKSKKSTFCPITLTCLMSFGLHANSDNFPPPSDCCPQECPCCSQPPMRVTVRHIDPNGIGYHPGYTTIEGFFTTFEPWCDAWVPFLDVRGHVFNNGKWAANAGIGLRYLTACRVWGANVYYDYRRTKHHHNFNQIGAGLESLGQTWDFRINGYFPVGKREKVYSNFQFDGFKGNSLILSRKREVAMTGFNAEVGYHYDCWECFPIYAAIGPYYLNGKGHSAWGGKLRARVDFWDYFHLEGNVSYDKIFKWIGQGEVGISYSFGCRRTIKTRCGNCCDTALTLSDRSLQPVDRFEIIAIDDHRKKEKAIDPITGQPWFFIFVNNLSHSLGTFESPFPTLLEAQNASHPNDAIYVFPGDGTTNGYASGITLQYGQWLLGAGNTQIIPTTVGNFVIPPLASIQPKITNSSGGNMVTLSNDNVVSGFDFIFNTVDQSGIVGTGINNLTAIQNTFIVPTTVTDTNGIFLTNPTGVVNVGTSIFSNMSDKTSFFNGNGVLVLLNNGSTFDTLNVFGSTFTNITEPSDQLGGNGILLYFEGTGSTLNNWITSGNTFSNISNIGSGVGTVIGGSGNTLNNWIILENTFSYINNAAYGVYSRNNADNTVANWVISNNIVSNLENNGFGFYSENFTNSVIDNWIISDNTFTNIINSLGILVQMESSTFANWCISGNTFSNISGNSMAIIPQFFSPNAIPNWSIINNTFSNISEPAVAIDLSIILSAPSALNVSGNTFTVGNPLPNSNGYAADIRLQTGTLCLEFTDNIAPTTPAPPPYPYRFTRTGGTFDESTVSGNTGQITTSGTIGAPGSCTSTASCNQ